MSTNMSILDRRLRAFLVTPAMVAAGALVGPAGVWAIVLYVLAAVMVATAAAGFCPLYALLRLDSRGKRRPLPH